MGVGTGATVGKLFREESWMKGGLGVAKVSLPGGVVVTALTVVNAFGDVLGKDGRVLAGARLNGDFANAHEYMLRLTEHPHFGRMEQTTLSVVITNARFRKPQCHLIARMAHDGMARAISPIHTPWTGTWCSCCRWVTRSATSSRRGRQHVMWWRPASAGPCAWPTAWGECRPCATWSDP